MKYLASAFFLLLIFFSCKSKGPEKDTSGYFPILSYLQSQVKQLDTSLYRFTLVKTAANRSDSQIISREDIRKYANDFLNIPDIKKPKIGARYDDANIYDSLLGIVILTYLANDEDQEVVRQEVHVVPTFDGNDKVKSIYIDKTFEEGDGITEKKMIWEVGKFFSIRTIIHKDDEAQQIRDLKVIWQDFQSN